MPYVSAYYRRPAGGGAEAGPSKGRQPDVAIYNAATGTTLLRGWQRKAVEGLEFSTGLPGGFLEAAFTLRAPAPKLWPVDTGQKVIIRWGNRTVWWGWVEDVRRVQRGRTEELGVTCLGPWQNCQQRLAESWTANAETAEGLKAALLQYCERISSNYAHITATGVTAAAQTQAMVAVSNIVKDVCQTGNSSQQPMLFAVWEPNPLRLEVVSPTNLVPNNSFETGTTTDATGWTEAANVERSNVLKHSGSWGMKVAYANSGTVASTDYIAVTAGKYYTLGIWHAKDQETAGTAGLTRVDVAWYTSGDALISTTTYVDVTDYALTTTAWQQVLKRVQAPATAAKCKLTLYLSRVEVGALGNAAVDDITLYEEGESGGTEAKPVAWLWARDLSTADYLLHTARLDSGMDMSETTRELANAVWASYSSSYTTEAQNAASQTDYRRRDAVVDAGDVDATSAAAVRDAYLAGYKDPRDEPSSFTVARPGIITTLKGAPVDLPLIRAGQRLKIADGPYAGRVVLISSTRWSSEGLQITPEQEMSTPEMLARS